MVNNLQKGFDFSVGKGSLGFQSPHSNVSCPSLSLSCVCGESVTHDKEYSDEDPQKIWHQLRKKWWKTFIREKWTILFKNESSQQSIWDSPQWMCTENMKNDALTLPLPLPLSLSPSLPLSLSPPLPLSLSLSFGLFYDEVRNHFADDRDAHVKIKRSLQLEEPLHLLIVLLLDHVLRKREGGDGQNHHLPPLERVGVAVSEGRKKEWIVEWMIQSLAAENTMPFCPDFS